METFVTQFVRGFHNQMNVCSDKYEKNDDSMYLGRHVESSKIMRVLSFACDDNVCKMPENMAVEVNSIILENTFLGLLK